MFDLLDLLLLRRGTPSDDRTLRFRRIDGSPTAKVIYFLPWHTRFVFARQAGFTPLDFLACYEMPLAIVSSVPELCVQAMQGLVADAESLLQDRAIRGQGCSDRRLERGHIPRNLPCQSHWSPPVLSRFGGSGGLGDLGKSCHTHGEASGDPKRSATFRTIPRLLTALIQRRTSRP